jgi:hypothetical protein
MANADRRDALGNLGPEQSELSVARRSFGNRSLLVQWKRLGVSEILAAVLALASLAGFISGYLQLLSCFAHVEVDSAKVKAGYPGRLLVKPVRFGLKPKFKLYECETN